MKKTRKKKIKLLSRKYRSRYDINMDPGGFEGSAGPMTIDRDDSEPSFGPRKIRRRKSEDSEGPQRT